MIKTARTAGFTYGKTALKPLPKREASSVWSRTKPAWNQHLYFTTRSRKSKEVRGELQVQVQTIPWHATKLTTWSNKTILDKVYQACIEYIILYQDLQGKSCATVWICSWAYESQRLLCYSRWMVQYHM